MQIEFKNVSYQYQKGTAFEATAIEGVDFIVPDHKFVAVMGETGSGKTTALQLIKGLTKPTEGEILYSPSREGHDDKIIFSHLKQSKAQRLRLEEIWSRIGYMFQYPEHQLFEETVALDIAYGPKNLGYSQPKIDKSTRAAMEIVGLNYDEYAERSPFALSGGQMRRVAMAGILAMNPETLILDEPLSGLDPLWRVQLMEVISRLHNQKRLTTLCVTHHLDEVWDYADYFLVFSNKKLAFSGDRRQVLQAWEDNTLQMTPPSIVTLALQLQQRGILQQSLPELEMELVSEKRFANFIGQSLARNP